MTESKGERYIHQVFVIGVILKAVDGVLEILAGLVLLIAGNSITGFTAVLVHNELLEDPRNFIALQLQNFLPSLAAHAGFFALMYLVSHGVIKLILVAGLLRDKSWAYPTAIAVFTLFIVYQMYQYVLTHSPFLLVLSILDVIIIGLTWHEYRYFKKHRVFPT